MKQRLIRALQRGGVVAQIEPDRWGVWRGRDRRGRVIGVLTGAEIDVLRVRESLKPLGDGAPPIFVWSGSVLETPFAAPRADRLETAHGTAARPLIELLIARPRCGMARADPGYCASLSCRCKTGRWRWHCARDELGWSCARRQSRWRRGLC